MAKIKTVQLRTQLKKENKKPNDKIKWTYFGCRGNLSNIYTKNILNETKNTEEYNNCYDTYKDDEYAYDKCNFVKCQYHTLNIHKFYKKKGITKMKRRYDIIYDNKIHIFYSLDIGKCKTFYSEKLYVAGLRRMSKNKYTIYFITPYGCGERQSNSIKQAIKHIQDFFKN